MMGFKSFRSAARIIAGIETMHMVKRGQLGCPGGLALSPADSTSTAWPPRRFPAGTALPRPATLIATEPTVFPGGRRSVEAMMSSGSKELVRAVSMSSDTSRDSLVYTRALRTPTPAMLSSYRAVRKEEISPKTGHSCRILLEMHGTLGHVESFIPKPSLAIVC